MNRKMIVLAIGVGLAASAAVLADDLNPPPWRGQDGTTYAQWEFMTENPGPLPDMGDNPYGDTTMTVYTGVGQEWWDVWGGRDGVWPLSGLIEIEIPNRPEPLPYKEIWVQVTWAAQTPGGMPYLSETISGEAMTVAGDIELEPTLELPPADGLWHHTTYTVRLYPNPDFEIIRLGGSIMVDELVIDTICIPEPMTLSLVGLGALALLKRSRR